MKKLNYNKARKFYNEAKLFVKENGYPTNVPKAFWELYVMVGHFSVKFKRTPNEDEYELMISLFPEEEQKEIRKFSLLVQETLDGE